MKHQPAPPRPDLVRQPDAGFGWLDARLLRDGWLPGLGVDAIALLGFLALAADRNGVSYYARDRIAMATGLDVARVDRALALLIDQELIAHRPWRNGRRDGVWQILPVPKRAAPARRSGSASAGSVLRDLGFGPT